MASQSPRRRALLARIISRSRFDVIHGAVSESRRSGENAILYCMRVALAKTSRVMAIESRSRNDRRRDLVVIAADTVISFKNKIIGQPKNKRDAMRILKLLSGKRHDVVTGLAVFLRRWSKFRRGKKNDIIITKAVISRVWLKRLGDSTIHDYVRTGEPMDKAGAYAIQERGRRLVRKYSGSYTNIVGLPVEELKKIIRGFGDKGLPKDRSFEVVRL